LVGGYNNVSEKNAAPIFKVDEAPKSHEETTVFIFTFPLLVGMMCG
jgi:hypothetical protein